MTTNIEEADDSVQMHDATDDDAYAEGDPTLEDINFEAVSDLAEQIGVIQTYPPGPERDLAAVGLLANLYGDDLVML